MESPEFCEECKKELDYDERGGCCTSCINEFERKDKEAEKDREFDEMVALGYL